MYIDTLYLEFSFSINYSSSDKDVFLNFLCIWHNSYYKDACMLETYYTHKE